MELKARVVHGGLARDELAEEVGEPVSTFRQGATAMLKPEERIGARVQRAIDSAKEREQVRAEAQMGKMQLPPTAIIVDLAAEEERLKSRRVELAKELEQLELTIMSVQHLKSIYGPKGGGV